MMDKLIRRYIIFMLFFILYFICNRFSTNVSKISSVLRKHETDDSAVAHFKTRVEFLMSD